MLHLGHFFENFGAGTAVGACIDISVGVYVGVCAVSGVLVAVNMMENNGK
ncbi:hypothetical protein BDF21DRAFT_463109 [Thamnidium elegans]|nr:hypothetical protein BDF21DRAFT_463109 [Thamnidium elegans]